MVDKYSLLLFFDVLVLFLMSAPAESAEAREASVADRWAVIVMGLPGDAEHATRFQEISQAWQSWLVQTLEFKAEHVVMLSGGDEAGKSSATSTSIEQAFSRLNNELDEHDALWIFFLGHANYDGNRAFFHVPGPDPDAETIARWLKPLRCGEQVIWLTNSSAGWFVKPISRPGRIVIAATAPDFEFNSTEFPYALARVAKKPGTELDQDRDQKVSILELFASTVQETEQIFKQDQRVPTEHAQLDDDGDGQGTELPELLRIAAAAIASAESQPAATNDQQPQPPAQAPSRERDGRLSATVHVPYRATKEP